MRSGTLTIVISLVAKMLSTFDLNPGSREAVTCATTCALNLYCEGNRALQSPFLAVSDFLREKQLF